MRHFSNLSPKQRARIAIYYGKWADNRFKAAKHCDVTEQTISRCVHYFIEHVFEFENCSAETLYSYCQQMKNKALQNAAQRDKRTHSFSKKIVRQCYKQSFVIRKANIIQYYNDILDELKAQAYDCPDDQEDKYYEICSSIAIVDDIKHQVAEWKY